MGLHVLWVGLWIGISTLIGFAWGLDRHGGDPQPIDLDALRIEHEMFTLENGLTVIVHSDHSVPVVAVNLWYHVGSRNEQRGKTGFAHLFEHFFFNGSENYPHGFREAMDDLGVNNRNGTTNTDRTNFFEDVPVPGLERTLYLEADRMGWLAGNLSEEMLERERGVVQNEKRQRENQPYGRVFSRIVEAIYPYSHPYSWSTIGSMDDLEAATLDDVKTWYETYYGPNNCVLSLAGDITVERAQELVKKYFGPIEPGPPTPTFEAWVPELDADIRDTMQDRVPQARIYRVYHAPEWGHPELQHLALTTSILSGTKASRLDRRLIYETELATSVSAFTWEKEMTSSVIFMVTVKPGVDPAEAEAELDVVITEYLEEGPTQAELDRARTSMVADLTRGMERLGGFGGRSDLLAASMTYGGSPDAYLEHLRVAGDAQPRGVRNSAREWLERNHYTLVVTPFPELSAAEETIDRSILPDLGEAPDVPFPRVQSATLDNGLKVRLIERRTVPLVNLSLVVDAGYAADPEAQEGLAKLALDVMSEGTEHRTGFEVTEDLSSLGAELSTGSTVDLSFVQLRALSMNLRPSLDIFAEVVREPSFPEDMTTLARDRQIADIEQEKSQPVATALRIIPRLLYDPEHAYAMPMTGSGYETTVQSLGREDLVRWHDDWFLPNNSTLIVTGDISLEEILPEIERVFGDWAEGEAPTKEVGPVDATEAGTIYLIDKPEAPQSVIVAAHVSRPGGDEQDFALETVMRLFGGMSTSRLNRNLRLAKHWSYGVWGTVMDARGPRPFAVVAPVQSDKTKESMVEVVSEIRGIAGQRPIEGEEFESIKRNALLRLPGRFATLRSLESAVQDMVQFGYPPEYYYDYAANVRALTPAVLNEAAARFVQPDQLIWLVVGDVATIEAGIRELGYGTIVRLTPSGEPVDGIRMSPESPSSGSER